MATTVGICLVKNEAYFITCALMNVFELCDNIIIMDNLSDDLTIRTKPTEMVIYRTFITLRILDIPVTFHCLALKAMK